MVDTETDGTQGDASGTFSVPLPSGRYIVKVSVSRFIAGGSPPSTITAELDFMMPEGSTVCQVEAQYDDGSGGAVNLDCCTFQCRTKGGEKCGFPEFTSPSSPPKFYRTATVAGTASICSYGLDCTPEQFISSQKLVLSGACKLDPVTASCENGVLTHEATYTTSDGSISCGSYEGDTTGDFCSLTGFIGFDFTLDFLTAVAGAAPLLTGSISSKTPTVWTLTANEPICDSAVGEVTCTLSDEDTATDVEARVDAADYGDWGEADNCRSAWAFSDDANEYTLAQWRVKKALLIPLTEYQVTIEMWRSVYGADTFALYSTVVATETTDVDGNFVVSGDIPVADGYETVARTDCKITKT